jgi:hypothetical protein
VTLGGVAGQHWAAAAALRRRLSDILAVPLKTGFAIDRSRDDLAV